MMRIAFLTQDPGLYGANRSLLDLIEGLRPYGIEPCVVTPREGELSAELRRRAIEFRTCNLGRWISSTPKAGRLQLVQRTVRKIRLTAGHTKENLQSLPHLVAHLRAWRPDVVYSNSSLFFSGVLAAARLGIPHVWHLREFGDLDYGFTPDFGRNAQKWLIRKSNGVIAISESVRTHYELTTSSRMRVVPSGIAWESDFSRQRTEARRSNRLDSDRFTFALVGLLHPAKGQETAIRAFHNVVLKHKDVRLIIAGSGRTAHREALERLARDLELGHSIEFRGYVDDVFSLYQQSDAALMCSQHEGMGRVTVEAMAACLPVIGYNGGGTAEIVQHESNGLLYDGGSEALAACMMRLKEDRAWARRLGENAWHSVRARFTIEHYAASVYDVLREVTSASDLVAPETHPVLQTASAPPTATASGLRPYAIT